MRTWSWVVVVASLAMVAGCGKDRGGKGSDAGVDMAPGVDAGRDGGGGSDGSTSPDLASGVDGGFDGDGGVEPYVPTVEQLDPEFGRNGLVTAGRSGFGVGALWDVQLQEDGKIVAFGRNFDGMVVVRVTASGRLDPSFGNGGFRYLPWGQPRNGFFFQFGGMELDELGRVVIAGHVHPVGNLYQRAVVTRLTSDGDLDSTFADSGIYAPDPVGLLSSATDVALQSDGSIVVATRDPGPVIYRLTSTGSRDASFGTDGRFTPSFGGQLTDVVGLTALADDRVLFTGQSYANSLVGIGLGRMTADGAADPSFGGGTGWVVDAAQGVAQVTGYHAEVAPNGSILVAGARPIPGADRGSQFAVGRFSSNGSVDPTFGTDGWATESGEYGIAFDITVGTDGTIIAAGTSKWDGDRNASVVGLTDTGALDVDFAQDGLISSNTSHAAGVTLQPDGKIVTVGATGIARYLPDGTPDPAFTPPFPLSVGHRVERATAVAMQSDGKILVGGMGSIAGGTALVRLTADGRIDPTFTDGFDTIVNAPGSMVPRTIAFDSEGRILVGGADFGSVVSGPGFHVARLSPDGVSDQGFGTEGFSAGALIEASQSQTNAMAYVDDDAIFVGGFYVLEGTVYLGVLKIDSLGNASATWGASGLASSAINANQVAADAAMQIVPLSDGGLVVATLNQLYRFDSSGLLDTTFGVDGVVSGVGNVEAIVSDGGLLLLSRTAGAVEGTTAVELSRRRLDGTLDPSFGSSGIVREEVGIGASTPMGLSVMPDGTIYVASSRGDAWRQDAMTMRFEADGSIDRDFGDQGQLVMRLSEFSSELHVITQDSSGRLIMAGRAWTPDGGSDFAVVRFR